MSEEPKPTPMIIGAGGFESERLGNNQPNMQCRWDILIHLPKFQMFAVEKSRQSHGNVMEWIIGFVQDQCYQDAKAFFESYEQWHKAKGYWANEDVFGQLITE